MRKVINEVNVLDLTEYLTSQWHYIKSIHTTDEYDGGIFIDNRIITYSSDICESLIDSQGNCHNVVTGRAFDSYSFCDDDFEVKDGRVIDTFKNVRITTRRIPFQFNLRRYLLIYSNQWDSLYQHINLILHRLKNPTPFYYYKGLEGNMKKCEYAPFYEICYATNNNHSIDNYVPDEIFFNYEDKENAVNRVWSYLQIANKYLSGMEYKSVNTDSEMIKILNDRFNKQIKYVTSLLNN